MIYTVLIASIVIGLMIGLYIRIVIDDVKQNIRFMVFLRAIRIVFYPLIFPILVVRHRREIAKVVADELYAELKERHKENFPSKAVFSASIERSIDLRWALRRWPKLIVTLVNDHNRFFDTVIKSSASYVRKNSRTKQSVSGNKYWLSIWHYIFGDFYSFNEVEKNQVCGNLA